MSSANKSPDLLDLKVTQYWGGNTFFYILRDIIFLNKIYIIKCEKFNINKIVIIASAAKIFVFMAIYRHEDFTFANVRFELFISTS